jgi:hypothetical protein
LTWNLTKYLTYLKSSYKSFSCFSNKQNHMPKVVECNIIMTGVIVAVVSGMPWKAFNYSFQTSKGEITAHPNMNSKDSKAFSNNAIIPYYR